MIQSSWGTIREAAGLKKVSVKTIRRMITAGTIEAERFGPRLIRVNLATLTGTPLQFLGGESDDRL